MLLLRNLKVLGQTLISLALLPPPARDPLSCTATRAGDQAPGEEETPWGVLPEASSPLLIMPQSRAACWEATPPLLRPAPPPPPSAP